jgi:hypothetical protein
MVRNKARLVVKDFSQVEKNLRCPYGELQAKTPMVTNAHINLDKKGKPVDQSLYRSLIGHLLYLTASRLDFMFGVCLCA